MPPKGLYITKGYYPPTCPATGKKCNRCQTCFLTAIDEGKWLDKKTGGLTRRTQHYDARYDYKTKSLVYDTAASSTCSAIATVYADLEPTFRVLAQQSELKINQAIVNEYTSGQDITSHIDSVKLFGPVVATVSLGSSMVMRFTREGYEPYDVLLEAGDIVALSGEARYNWKHELLPIRDPNFRRVSITTRTVLA